MRPCCNTPASHALSCALLCTTLWLAGCAQPSPTLSQGSTTPSGENDIARVHTELGAEYLRLNQLDVALEEFNTAVQKNPGYALAYNGLGLVYAALGETVKAENAFQRAIQLQPGSSESHNNYGRFLCDQGRLDAAIKEFQLALKNPLYKTPHIAYYNAGVCSVRNQQLAQAEQFFSQALTIDPQSSASAYQLAKLQLQRGQPALAQSTLSSSVTQSPTPESLVLAIEIARALALRDDVHYYTVRLLKLFPNSKEAKHIQHTDPR